MKKINKDWVYWTPRILSILFLIFIALQTLDVFFLGLGPLETFGAFLIHNIPTLIMLVVVLITWKYEIAGGIAFVLAGVLYIVSLLISALNSAFEWYMLSWAIQFAGLCFFIGYLFFVNWFRKKK